VECVARKVPRVGFPSVRQAGSGYPKVYVFACTKGFEIGSGFAGHTTGVNTTMSSIPTVKSVL